MHNEFYKTVIYNSNECYAYHKIVTDETGSPVDYVFLEVNPAFEKATNLKSNKVIGKRVTEIFPGIITSKYDWIGEYGKVALSGKSTSIDQFFEPLGLWFNVKVYSNEKGFFVTVFHDITSYVEEKKALEIFAESSQENAKRLLGELDYQKLSDNILVLSDAKFAVINIYDAENAKIETKAVSGLTQSIKKATELLGFEIRGKKWDVESRRMESINDKTCLRFKSFHDATFGAFSKSSSFLLEKMFGIGEIHIINIIYRGQLLGDYILLMDKQKTIKNLDAIDLYAKQTANLVLRDRAENELRDRNEKLNSILDDLVDVIYSISLPDQNLIYISKSVRSIYGRDVQEFIDDPHLFRNNVHPDDGKIYDEMINRLMIEKIAQCEYRIIRPDGDVLWINNKAKLIIDEKNRPISIKGLLQDITWQKQAELQKLKHQNEIIEIKNIGLLANSTLDLETVLLSILKNTTRLVNASVGMIFVKDPCTGQIKWGASLGLSDEFVEEFKNIPIRLGEGLTGTIAKTGKYIYIKENSSHDPRIARVVINKEGLNSFLGAPVFADGQIIGVMNILTRHPDILEEHEVDIISAISSQIGLAIKNAQLFDEQKSTNAALNESKKNLDMFFERAFSGFLFMMLKDPIKWDDTADKENLLDLAIKSMTLTKINQALLDQYGAKEDDLIGKTFNELFSNNLAYIRQRLRELFDNGHLKTEINENKLDGTPIVINGDYICLYDEQKRITGMFGVQADITHDKEAEQKLKISERRFRLLVDNLQAGVIIHAPDTTIIDCNKRATELLGLSLDQMKGKKAFDKAWMFLDEDGSQLPLEKYPVNLVLANKEPLNDLVIGFRGYLNDDIKWGIVNGNLFYDDDGEISEIVISFIDYTEQKNSSDKIKESEEEYRLLTSQMQLGLALHEIICDEKGDPVDYRFISANKSFERLTGLVAKDIKGKTVLEVLPETEEYWIKTYGKVALTGESMYLEEYSSQIGRYFSVAAYSPKKDQFAVVIDDITDKIMAEKKLLESEARYRSFITVSSIGAWEYHRRSGFMWCSPEYFNMLGYDPSMFEMNNDANFNEVWFDLVHPDDRIRVKKKARKYLENGAAGMHEDTFRMRHANGSYVWILSRGQPIRNPDGSLSDLTIGVNIDITKNKKAEIELLEYKTFVEQSMDGIAYADMDGIIIFTNKAWANSHGYSVSELIGKHLSIFHTKDQLENEVAPFLEKLRRLGSNEGELYHLRKDGAVFPMMMTSSIIKDENGDPIGMLAIGRDITRRKHADEALRESEASLKRQNELMNSLLNNLTSGVFMIEAKSGKPLIANPMAEKLLGRGITGDANIDNLSDIYEAYKVGSSMPYPTDEMPIKKAINGESSHIDDMIVKRPDGTILQLEVFGTPIRDEKARIWAGLVNFQDISVRKKMEHELYREKEQFKTTLLSVGDGIISTDVDGNVDIINKIAEKLTGWTQKEAFGKPVEEVFHIVNEFTRNRCDNPVVKVLDSGSIVALENHTILISKERTECAIEDSAAPIKDEKGNITGVVLVFRDFTEKKKSQEEIKHLSFHDFLTGLYNRRFFEAELKRLDTQRNWPLTIIMGDVNGLKLINDSFGHSTGDQLLIKAAEAIKKGCRGDDIISRIGGDEFVILLPQTDGFEAEQLIKRIKSLFKKLKIAGVEISVSFGYETKNSRHDDIESTLKKAEDMMYNNKLFESPSIRGRVIDNIIKAINSKSQREQTHSKRVSELCEKMGEALGLEEYKVKELKAFGLLHDIGKIAIADNILNKPGTLTDKEMIEMRRHAETGYRILSTANDMSEIAEYVLAHHERWDGKGYPKGLKGEDIPLVSRICAIVDAFDAMTSERSYRTALPKEDVLEELTINSGKQFDPVLLKVFIEEILSQNSK